MSVCWCKCASMCVFLHRGHSCIRQPWGCGGLTGSFCIPACTAASFMPQCMCGSRHVRKRWCAYRYTYVCVCAYAKCSQKHYWNLFTDEEHANDSRHRIPFTIASHQWPGKSQKYTVNSLYLIKTIVTELPIMITQTSLMT